MAEYQRFPIRCLLQLTELIAFLVGVSLPTSVVSFITISLGLTPFERCLLACRVSVDCALSKQKPRGDNLDVQISGKTHEATVTIYCAVRHVEQTGTA